MKKLVEVLFITVLLALLAWAAVAFWSRGTNGPQAMIVTTEPHKIQVVDNKGERITVKQLVFVDGNGKETMTINAGPPATLEITDQRGRKQVLDLARLAQKASFFTAGE